MRAQIYGEIEKGWLAEPNPIKCFGWDRTVPCVRFPIEQAEKIRCCDDFKKSRMNEWAWLGSNITLPSISTLAELACMAGNNINLWKADHENAYRQVPLKGERSDLSIICFLSEEGEWLGCRPRTLLFGASLSAMGYNLCSRFLSALFCKFFGMPCIAFYDDFAGVAREYLGDIPLKCFKGL